MNLILRMPKKALFVMFFLFAFLSINVILFIYNMASIPDIILYFLTFLSVYVQVFFLVTFLDNRKKIITRNGCNKLSKYPKVTILVPAWNEEKTIYKTIRSILDLNYPKDKIKIFLINDGSTDKTWNVISKFTKFPNVSVFNKENGGKYTALNLGLEHVETDFLGCLDADSVVDRDSLVRIMSYFEKDPTVMAVAPSIIAVNSKNFIQKAQEAEYFLAVYMKKMLGFLGAIHVTPGPFTIFRKKVFDDLGPYKHAHNTEDMEIAYRMQKNNYKIEQCNDAYVYTNTPISVVKLYRQRVRWIYGSINNTIDYRGLIFKKKYGNFSFFTLPMIIISFVAVCYILGKIAYNFIDFLFSKITQFEVIGFHLSNKMNFFDPFFINTQSLFFISLILYALVLFSIILGRKMANDKNNYILGIFYYFIIFTIIGPFWLFKATYNTIFSRKPAWR
ncbi:MAG: glycosyltransferase [Candidatus Paceibacterota bacterium]